MIYHITSFLLVEAHEEGESVDGAYIVVRKGLTELWL